MKRLIAVALLLSTAACVDLNTPRPYACAYDGGADQCPENWVCGLENRCHQLGDPQPWMCLDDTQCEAQWRCGPDGTCLDPSREALVGADSGPVGATLIAPVNPNPPLLVGGSREDYQALLPGCPQYPWNFDGGYSFDYFYGEVVTTLRADGVHREITWQSGHPMLRDGGFPRQTDCDAGHNPDLVTVTFDDVVGPLLVDSVALADMGSTAYVLGDGGELCRYALREDLTLSSTCRNVFAPSMSAKRLRGGEIQFGDPVLLAIGPTQFQTYFPEDGGVFAPRGVYATDGGLLPINDLMTYGDTLPVWVAATREGIYVRAYDGLGIESGAALTANRWEPISVGPFYEEGSAVGYFEPIRIGLSPTDRYAHDAFQVLTRSDPSAGPVTDQLYSIERAHDDGGWGRPAATPPYLPTEGYYRSERDSFVMPVASCRTCPTGSKTKWFHAAPEAPFLDRPPPAGIIVPDNPYKIETRCENPDGGAELVGLDPSGQCDPFPYRGRDGQGDVDSIAPPPPPASARFSRPTIFDFGAVRGTTVADDLGHVWSQPRTWRWAVEPTSLDRAPAVAFQTVTGAPGVIRPEETFGRALDVPYPLTPLGSFEETPLGYRRGVFEATSLSSDVAGYPTWVMLKDSFNDVPVVGVFGLLPEGTRGDLSVRALARLPTPLDFGAPYHAAATVTSSGRKILVATTFDTLTAVDLTDQLAIAVAGTEFALQEVYAAPELLVKLTQVAHTPVQSITLLDAPADGSQFIDGYLLQANRIFHFDAPNFTVWHADEVLLEDLSEPLSVFHDGARARVGMKTGAVYSLPSRLLLAPTLPAAAMPVQQYLQHCGQLFALASDGIYRLAVGDAPTGTWEPISGPLPASALAGGLLQGTGSTVRAFSNDGRVLKLDGFSCRAPAR